MNKKEATMVLSILMTAYPHVKIENPDIMAKAWEMCFSDYDADIISHAVKLHMKSNKFFPTVAEITELIPRALLLTDPVEVHQIESNVEQANIDGEALFKWLCEDDPIEECYFCEKYHDCYLQK